MFGFFKKKVAPAELLTALIQRQTSFSVNGLKCHEELFDASPDKKKAKFEAFLFNNWLSYYLLTIEFSKLSRSDKSISGDIGDFIITFANRDCLPELEKRFGVKASDYCTDFISYAKQTFKDYDSSVSRHLHAANPGRSAAIRLITCSGIHVLPDLSNYPQIQQLYLCIEAVFFMLESGISQDVKKIRGHF